MNGGITLFLCGDVMTGRGIDQVLPHPAPPDLYEPWVQDAREYVTFAEDAHGEFARPMAPAGIWGDALAEKARRRRGPQRTLDQKKSFAKPLRLRVFASKLFINKSKGGTP